jgi:hypothetical protein
VSASGRLLTLAVGAMTLLTASAMATAQAPKTRSWDAVDQALGRKGTLNPGAVQKYSFPRSDLQVSAKGVALKPAFALGSWVALKDIGGGHAMMMGDLVLADSEVSAVMQTLQAGGVQQTALHNHVLGESPRVMYMHVTAHDDPARIARTLREALARTGTPLTPPAAANPAPIDIDTAAIARRLGFTGKGNGGVYQVSVPRAETVREGGHEVPASMGLATAINFQPTGGGKAAITGDFVLIASEVNPVIRALRDNGIEVTALHSHMLTEQPRLFFMHFWANDDAQTLARGLRAALDRMAVKRS